MNIHYSDAAKKQLKKLDKPIQKRIKDYLADVSALEDPRSRGKGLVSNFSGYWRYRVGDYRIICRIKDDILLIDVIFIRHRSEVYS